MKLSHVMGLTAIAAALATSGLASAVTIYGADGFITDSTCTAPQLAVGVESQGQLYLQASGVVGSSVESAGTPSSASATGSTVTYSCPTSNGAPAKLNGQTMTFVCHTDTQSGPGAASYILTQKFTVTSTNSKNANTVDTLNTLLVSNGSGGFMEYCHWTTDGTYITQ